MGAGARPGLGEELGVGVGPGVGDIGKSWGAPAGAASGEWEEPAFCNPPRSGSPPGYLPAVPTAVPGTQARLGGGGVMRGRCPWQAEQKEAPTLNEEPASRSLRKVGPQHLLKISFKLASCPPLSPRPASSSPLEPGPASWLPPLLSPCPELALALPCSQPPPQDHSRQSGR